MSTTRCDFCATENLGTMPTGWLGVGSQVMCPACARAHAERTAAGWVRLQHGNDWGLDFYSMPGEGRTPAGCHDSRYAAIHIEALAGQIIQVRMTDGTILDAKIVVRSSGGGLTYDMGHVVPLASGKTFGLAITLHGQDIILRPSEVDLPLTTVLEHRGITGESR